MKRIMLLTAYDGTQYHGFQVQPNLRTVEGVLNQTLSELLKEEIIVIGASRTDTGVHAEGNVAVFDTETKIPPEKIALALNQRLPEDLVIQKSIEVPINFHPRHTNCRKTYEYRIYNHVVPNPLLRRDTYFYYRPLDVSAMQEAASFLVGTKDFSSFCAAGTQVVDKVRTIDCLEVKRKGDLITIQITGNGFLYNMVRIITGTLILVGIHTIIPEDMKKIIQVEDRKMAGPTAPAKGLVLKKIQYEEAELSLEKSHL